MKFVVKKINAKQVENFFADGLEVEGDDWGEYEIEEAKSLDGHLALCVLQLENDDWNVEDAAYFMLTSIITQDPSLPLAISDVEMMSRAFGVLGEDVYNHRMIRQDREGDALVPEIDIRTPEAAERTIALIKKWLHEMLEEVES